LFPGSTLFKKRPPWVMSAELVETTKLYARTNAPVRPEWIERAAQVFARLDDLTCELAEVAGGPVRLLALRQHVEVDAGQV